MKVGPLGPIDQWTIRDGAQTWLYIPIAKKYRNSPSTTASAANMGSADPSVWFGLVTAGLQSAQTAPDEDVILEGSPIHCYVVSANYGPSPARGSTERRVIFWIDQMNFIVLRRRVNVPVRRAQSPEPLERTLDLALTKLTLAPAMTGSEFVFTPPEGATEMETPRAAGPSTPPPGQAVPGTVRAATLIKRVTPEYPKAAKDARIQGPVRFAALLGKDGTVKSLELISGHPLLVDAARDAVKQWLYNPTLLNGEPVEVKTELSVNFSLNAAGSAPQAGAGAPTAPSPQGAYRIGGGVSAPTVISKTEPQYSEEARKARLQGTVLIALVVGEDGEPRNVRVLKSLGLGLDEKAMETVRTWRFAPGQKEGAPVPVLATIQVNFRLGDVASYWRLDGALYNLPAGASRPLILMPVFPPASPSRESGSVTLALDVDEQGSPVDIRVEKSSDPKWEEELIAAVRKWSFQPGTQDGMPVRVPLRLEFSRVGEPSGPASAPAKTP